MPEPGSLCPPPPPRFAGHLPLAGEDKGKAIPSPSIKLPAQPDRLSMPAPIESSDPPPPGGGGSRRLTEGADARTRQPLPSPSAPLRGTPPPGGGGSREGDTIAVDKAAGPARPAFDPRADRIV